MISRLAVYSLSEMKSSILFVILFTASTALARFSDVCLWQGAGFIFTTTGYSWGGGDFDSLEECTDALRATLIFLDFGQGDSKGEIIFTAKNGEKYFCQMIPRQFPFSKGSEDFNKMMERAYNSNSSAAEIAAYRDYLNENLSLICQ